MLRFFIAIRANFVRFYGLWLAVGLCLLRRLSARNPGRVPREFHECKAREHTRNARGIQEEHAEFACFFCCCLLGSGFRLFRNSTRPSEVVASRRPPSSINKQRPRTTRPEARHSPQLQGKGGTNIHQKPTRKSISISPAFEQRLNAPHYAFSSSTPQRYS